MTHWLVLDDRFDQTANVWSETDRREIIHYMATVAYGGSVLDTPHARAAVAEIEAELNSEFDSSRAIKRFDQVTSIQKAVLQLGSYSSPYYLNQLGFSDRDIQAAVNAGQLEWQRHGFLGVKGGTNES